ASIYGHFPLALETFARTYGRDKLMNAIGRFARDFRFRHPGPDDLVASFEKVYSPWFVREILRPALFHGHSVRFSLQRARLRDGTLEIVAQREGTLPLPTTVAITYRDGSVERLPFPASRTQLAIER